MPVIYAVGATLPQWKFDNVLVNADRIHAVEAGVIFLESGARVEATEELLASGPFRLGDFVVFDGPHETLVDGGDFRHRAYRAPAQMTDLMPAAELTESPVVDDASHDAEEGEHANRAQPIIEPAAALVSEPAHIPEG